MTLATQYTYLKVQIGTVDYTSYLAAEEQTATLPFGPEIGRASLVLLDTAAAMPAISPWGTVTIYAGTAAPGTPVWGGYATRQTREPFSYSGGTAYRVAVDCQSFAVKLAATEPITETYGGGNNESVTSDYDIVDDLVSTYLPEFYNAGLIGTASPVTVNYIQFDNESLRSCLNKVTERAAGRDFGVTAEADFYYRAGTVVGTVGYSLAETADYSASYPMTAKPYSDSDAQDLRNAVRVVGGWSLSAVQEETFVTDGSAYIFQVDYFPAQVVAVELANKPQTVGVYLVDDPDEFDCLVHYDTRRFYYGTPPATGQTLEIRYRYPVRVEEDVVNAASVAAVGGTLWAPAILDNSISSSAVAQATGSAYLASAATVLTRGQVTTTYAPIAGPYTPGQHIQFSASSLGWDNTKFQVQSVTMRFQSRPGSCMTYWDLDLGTPTPTVGAQLADTYTNTAAIRPGNYGPEIADPDGLAAWVTSGVFYADLYGLSTAGSAADNAKAIQAAVDALEAAGGGVVQLPPGEFAVADNTITLPELDYRVTAAIRGSASGSTVLYIETPDDGWILKIQGTWQIENVLFKGYEDGADSAAGIGALVQKMDEPGGFHNCRFSILEYGIKTDVYETYETGSAMNNSLIESCAFEACKEAGVYIGDVHNANHVINCHFQNGYPAGAGSGYGLYAGYQSNLVIDRCNFRTHKNGIYLKGAQGPQIKNCYFETTSTDSAAYIVTTRTVAPLDPANYEVRNLTVDGCVASFYDNTQSFAQLRYCFNATFSNNWTTAAGDGLIDADTTVKGLVLLNNRNDDSNTPLFKDDNAFQPYTPPNGSTVKIVDIDSSGIPYIHSSKTCYSLPDASGNHSFAFYANGTLALYAEANYVNIDPGLKIGAGTEITKHFTQSATYDWDDVAANATEDSSDITITGISNGTELTLTPTGVMPAGVVFQIMYKTTSTAVIRCANVTTSTVTVGSRSFLIGVRTHA